MTAATSTSQLAEKPIVQRETSTRLHGLSLVVARSIWAVDCKVQAEERRKRALDTLFKTLLQNLMSGKTRPLTI